MPKKPKFNKLECEKSFVSRETNDRVVSSRITEEIWQNHLYGGILSAERIFFVYINAPKVLF